MRAAFVHDHVFVRWRDRIYSPGRLPYRAWRRYLEHFESLSVVARVREARSENEVATLAVADGPGVRFCLQPVRHGINRLWGGRRETKDMLRAVLAESSAVIARVPSEYGLQAVRMASAMNLAIALEVVGDAFYSLWHHGSIAAKAYAPVLHWRTKLASRQAERALYVTQEYLQRRYPCPGATVSASNVVIPRPSSETLNRRLHRIRQGHGVPVIGFVGTLADRHKGLDTAVRAVANLRQHGLACTLEVVGEGESAPWFGLAQRLGVADSVRFLGPLPNSDAVREWFSAVDVYVQPSKGGEGLPRALIEAMSSGCAAYGTTVGGIPELLPERCLFAPGDWRKLSELIASACCDAGTREELASRNITTSELYAADVLEGVRRGFFRDLAAVAAARTPGSKGK